MLTAEKTSVWSTNYRLAADGRPVADWDAKMWRSGGDFVLDGRHYAVRGNFWGSRFTMTDDAGVAVASADRVGRKRWTVEAGGQTYEFRRVSLWNDAQELYNAAGPIGAVRRTSVWRGNVTADLPGLPMPVQIFVVGVVIMMWEAQSAGAA